MSGSQPFRSPLRLVSHTTYRRYRDFTHVWLGIDAFTGWNILRFDFDALIGRFKVVTGAERCLFMSRYVGRRCNTKHKKLKSNALGHNLILNPFEAMVLDGFMEDKTINNKRESNSLKNVAGEELGEEYAKDPVTTDQMFAVWDATEEGFWIQHAGMPPASTPSPEDVWKVVRYCAQDSIVAMEIVGRLGYFLANLEMSHASYVPFHILVVSGQQIKVLLLLLNFAHARGYVLNNLCSKLYASSGFAGGAVIQAHPAYIAAPIAIEDFASLYPSIMMAYNLCFSTMVRPEDVATLKRAGTPMRVCNTSEGTFHFVRSVKTRLPIKAQFARAMAERGDPVEFSPDGKLALFREAIPSGCRNEGEEGILVAMEAYLKNMRNGYKSMMGKGWGKVREGKAKEAAIRAAMESGANLNEEGVLGRLEEAMGAEAWGRHGAVIAAHLDAGGALTEEALAAALSLQEEGKIQASNYNARQLTAKVFMNAIFGFSGGASGPYPFYPLAASITQQGSQMIRMCTDYAEGAFSQKDGGIPMRVVYGDTDSVMIKPQSNDVTASEALPHFRRLETLLTILFPPPVEMEFEEMLGRMLLKGPKMCECECECECLAKPGWAHPLFLASAAGT